ncbi:MAG: ABC transporter ATP-binding protein [Patescibacteria group bacterium]
MKNLFKYLRPYSLSAIAVVILIFGQVMANLQLPDFMAQIVNQGIVGNNTSLILSVGFKMLLVALAGAVCTVGVSYFSSRISTGFSKDLREKVFAKIESFSLTEFNKFSTASLITRSTNDIGQIESVLNMLIRMIFFAPAMGIGSIFKAYHMAPSMAWIMVISITAIMITVSVLFIIAKPKFMLLQKLIDKLNLVTRQNLTGIRVIRAFNTEKYEEEKFDEVNTNLTNLNLFVNRLMAAMQPIMTLLMNLTTITVIWVGVRQVNAGSLQVGDMMAFMQYATQAFFAFLMFSMFFVMIPRASVSIDRVSEILETESDIKDPRKPVKISKKENCTIEFRNVSFSYPGAEAPVLQNISFIAKSGETTAFVGGTGSGKSTLINLIPRFYDPTQGEILINGTDIRALKLADLYQQIGVVPQKGILFSGTICSNIKYGVTKASDTEMKRIAKIAQAEEFIQMLPQKYETLIAQGGTNVSGGQKQRLAIARALIKKPQIYIFDDSFSALDFKTDSELRKALKPETEKSVVLIVAQRVSTIMNADQIIVLDEGKIAGIGKHHELLKSCHVYREIVQSQLSEEELTRKPKEKMPEEKILKKKKVIPTQTQSSTEALA